MKKSMAAAIISSIFVFVFAYTAFSKLSDMNKFRFTMRQVAVSVTGQRRAAPENHNQLPAYIFMGAGVVAWTVPLTELAIVLLLFFSKTRRAGLFASVLLLTVFTTFLLAMLLFGKEIPCGCGGVIAHLGWWEHVAFNLGLMMLGLAGWRWASIPPSPG
jgi:hypothetical protein